MNMTYDFAIKFYECQPLEVKLIDTPLAQRYLALLYRNYCVEPPVVRDQGAFDQQRLQELANQCRKIFGWNWVHQDYTDLAVTTRMHKDIEQYLAQGYNRVAPGHDELLHELHICLHSVQYNSERTTMQLEWFNDDQFPIQPGELDFVHDNTLGAILLQNAYVGHPPMWLFQQNDHINVWQTCRFHDIVKPGIVIQMQGSTEILPQEFEQADLYLNWWRTVAQDFVNYHGEKKLLDNAGKPVIGYVINREYLYSLLTKSRFELEYIEFTERARSIASNCILPPRLPLTRQDYNNLAGPDWPCYDNWLETQELPEFVRAEILDMIGVHV